MTIKKAIEKMKKKITRKKVVFTLAAPGANNVSLVGTFNNWNFKKHKMEKNKEGLWTKTLIIPLGEYQYKFLVGSEWRHDPVNENVISNEYGTLNSIVTIA